MSAMDNWDAIFSYANEHVCGLETAGPPSYLLDILFLPISVKFGATAMCVFGARAKGISIV